MVGAGLYFQFICQNGDFSYDFGLVESSNNRRYRFSFSQDAFDVVRPGVDNINVSFSGGEVLSMYVSGTNIYFYMNGFEIAESSVPLGSTEPLYINGSFSGSGGADLVLTDIQFYSTGQQGPQGDTGPQGRTYTTLVDNLSTSGRLIDTTSF